MNILRPAERYVYVRADAGFKNISEGRSTAEGKNKGRDVSPRGTSDIGATLRGGQTATGATRIQQSDNYTRVSATQSLRGEIVPAVEGEGKELPDRGKPLAAGSPKIRT